MTNRAVTSEVTKIKILQQPSSSAWIEQAIANY